MVGKSLSNSQIKRRFQWANHQSKREKFEQTTFVEGIRCIKVKSTWYWCVLCFVCVSIFTHTLHVCMFILFTGTYYFECISSWICWPRAMFFLVSSLGGWDRTFLALYNETFWDHHSMPIAKKSTCHLPLCMSDGSKGLEKKPIWGVPKIEVPNNRWLIMENQIKMADLGVLVHSHFRKRPYTVYIYTQTHRIDLSIYTCAQQHNIENPPWK